MKEDQAAFFELERFLPGSLFLEFHFRMDWKRVSRKHDKYRDCFFRFEKFHKIGWANLIFRDTQNGSLLFLEIC